MIELEAIIPKNLASEEDFQWFLAYCSELLRKAVSRMQNILKVYPPYKYIPWGSPGVPWVSERQRRYVLANIRKGIIQVPYQRTNALSQSWKMGSSRTSDAITWWTGTDHPRAKYVQGDNEGKWQHARMQQMGHRTVKSVAQTQWPKEARKIQQDAAKWKPRSGG